MHICFLELKWRDDIYGTREKMRKKAYSAKCEVRTYVVCYTISVSSRVFFGEKQTIFLSLVNGMPRIFS